MFKKLNLLFFILFLLPAAAFAQDYKIDAAKSTVKFSVSAAVYTIRGKAHEVESRVSFNETSGTVNLPMKVEIPVDSLKTKNKLRDKDMRKMFDSKQYPLIVWTAEEVECTPRNNAEGAFACAAKGTLAIKGAEKKISFPVDLQIEKDGIRASGLIKIKRSDYGLKTPSMLGLIRVAQDIEIEFNTVWTAA